MEVFAGDDIGGGLRPAFWNLDVFLLEDCGPFFVADQSGALFPFDLVERRNLSIREVPFKNQTAGQTGGVHRFRSLDRFPIQCVLHRSHPDSSPQQVPVVRAGNPSILLPWRAGGCVSASKTQLDSWSVWKASPRNHRKKRMRCPMPVKFTRPNSRLHAYLRLRGEGTSRSFFAVIPGWSVGQSRTKTYPRLGPSGASTSPESGFAVSDQEELVSRENRKIWGRNFQGVYI